MPVRTTGQVSSSLRVVELFGGWLSVMMLAHIAAWAFMPSAFASAVFRTVGAGA